MENVNEQAVKNCKKFMVYLDEPFSAKGTSEITFTEGTQFLISSKNGNSTATLEELIPLVNRHNTCVAQQVFNCGLSYDDIPVYSADGEETIEVEEYVPVDGYPWGYTQGCIAWYKNNQDMMAVVLVPGYRLLSINDTKTGVILEDVNKDRTYVQWGEYPDILNHETKRDYLDFKSYEDLIENYQFRDWDYFRIATETYNYREQRDLLKVYYPDFKKLCERFEQNGLDDETCLEEGNVKISEPWIAFFKKPLKNRIVAKAYIGVPGYKISEISNDNEKNKPGLYIIDENNEKIWVHWNSWHVCLSYKSYAEWKTAQKQGLTKKSSYVKRTPYAGVNKGVFKRSVENVSNDVNATAIWDNVETEDKN